MGEGTEENFPTEATGKGASILVVDDNQEVRTSLSSLLSTMGFQVTQALDGDEALVLISISIAKEGGYEKVFAWNWKEERSHYGAVIPL